MKTQAANRKDISTANRGVHMEHRHFAFIAATIAAMPDFAPSLRAQKESVTSAFADALAKTNPRFDRDRFIAAAKGKRNEHQL